jgi:excisionase family DNA binding protein
MSEPRATGPVASDVLAELLTASQVAAFLEVPRSTVEDYGRRGVLPSIVLGKHRRYIRGDLVAALDALRSAPARR